MQEQPEIPHNALVLIGDGRKALILRNLGAQRRLKFEQVRFFEHETPRTSEMGTDRPGRMGRMVGTMSKGRTAFEQTDWHHLEEARFVRAVEEALTRAVQAEPSAQIIVVMPPKALGEFRAGMSSKLKPHVIGEIAKDLTQYTVTEIERHLRHPDAVD